VPWSELPAELEGVLRPFVPALSEEIVAAIGREVEEYRRPLEGPFGRAVREGTEVALDRFVDLLGGEAGAKRGGRFYVALGEAEFRAGRTLDSLLAAYRLGARLAWRRSAEAGEAAGVEPGVLYRLGEAIFAYIDELSAESAEGYAQAQSAAAGERQQRRRQLVALLLAEPPAEEHALRAAAQEAGWPLPQRLAALAIAGEDAVRRAAALGAEALAAPAEDGALALIPDPDAPGRRAQLERVLGAGREAAPGEAGRAVAREGAGAGGAAGRGAADAAGVAAAGFAVLGPAVAWPEAGLSLRRARLAQRLVASGFVEPEPLVVADDHHPTLLLHSDPRAAADLAAGRLAPLAELPAATRAKLTATLRAWLDHGGRVEETARRLEVHPQTVRYRVRQLRGLFGAALDDPEQRFALALALRAS
jgi:hypothetical protein